MSNDSSQTRPADRAATLARNRQAKMAESAHAYVRGNTAQFYAWLSKNSKKTLPEGPPIWICGDCHVGNIGPLADAEGHVEIQIRDLDQTVLGNPAHDLVRLALSLATAARGSDLPGITLVRMLEEMVVGYEQGISAPKKATDPESVDELRLITSVLDQSYRRRWHHLAEERIEDVRPQIPLGKRFWGLEEEERLQIDRLFAEEAVMSKICSLKGDDEQCKVRVLDAAYWMKGCSSLGRLRYAVLLGVGRKHKERYCLVDLKEATAPAAPHAKQHFGDDDAHRVVTGACGLSPNLGKRMLPVRLMRRAVVLRELMPQDLKFDLDRLTRDEAVAAARYLAQVVGKAHGRQMDRQTAMAWKTELRKRHSKTLDAPGWLWSSVTALIADHEVAYLEHCRRYVANQ